MRNSLWLALLVVSVSCTSGNTLSSTSLEYLRCPTAVMPVAIPDTGAASSDQSLFGSSKTTNSNNCINDQAICASLGMSFVCNRNKGCCDEIPSGRCTKTADCTDNTAPVCDLASNNNTCVACSATDTTLGDKQCGDWVTARNDPTNRALCIGGQCLECRKNSDCHRTGNGFCDTKTATCGGCTENSQCPGSICKSNPGLLMDGEPMNHVGDCADPKDIAYVYNMAPGCMAGDGSKTNPYCQITDAINKGKFYIYVPTGSSSLYNTVTLSGVQRLAIVGPPNGRDSQVSEQASINGISVTGSATLALVEVSVNNISLPAAVQCTGSGTIYVNKSLIGPAPTGTDFPKAGIITNGCTVNVEKTKINGAQGYGLGITGGMGHRVVNNAIIRNGLNTILMQPSGMNLSNVTKGLFSFNTIAGNRHGVQCDSSVSVTDSIVIENTDMQQVSGNCQPSRIVSSGVVLDPSYSTTGKDPKLMSDQTNVCVDKGMADASIKDDYFGNARPLGTAYDIGFQEVR